MGRRGATTVAVKQALGQAADVAEAYRLVQLLVHLAGIKPS